MNGSRLGTTAVPSTLQNLANFGVGPPGQPSFSNDAGELNLTPDSRIKRIKSSLIKVVRRIQKGIQVQLAPCGGDRGLVRHVISRRAHDQDACALHIV